LCYKVNITTHTQFINLAYINYDIRTLYKYRRI